jgi:hypothetical protein
LYPMQQHFWGSQTWGLWGWRSPYPKGRTQVALVRAHQQGLVLRFANQRIGLVMIGWYPRHTKCMASAPFEHSRTCLSARLPEFEIGHRIKRYPKTIR